MTPAVQNYEAAAALSLLRDIPTGASTRTLVKQLRDAGLATTDHYLVVEMLEAGIKPLCMSKLRLIPSPLWGADAQAYIDEKIAEHLAPPAPPEPEQLPLVMTYTNPEYATRDDLRVLSSQMSNILEYLERTRGDGK